MMSDDTRIARLESNVTTLNRDSTNFHTRVSELQQLYAHIIERLAALEKVRDELKDNRIGGY